MKCVKKIEIIERSMTKDYYQTSDDLLNQIISCRKKRHSGNPPIPLEKIICKNACRLGSD